MTPRKMYSARDENIPRDQMVCRAVDKVHEQIQILEHANLPLIWSEYNASYMNETDVTDSIFMGPWLADTIRQCDGLVDMMSYWTFSDVFEEQGVVKTPFYGGYGLIAEDDIPKPAFNAFKLLHRLGIERIRARFRIRAAYAAKRWNVSARDLELCTARTKPVLRRRLHCDLKTSNAKRAFISRLDAEHGDVHEMLRENGKRHGTPPRDKFWNCAPGRRTSCARSRSHRRELTDHWRAHGSVIELR